jgi:hypothetical protein
MDIKFTLSEKDITKLCAERCSDAVRESGKFDAAFECGPYSRSVVVTFTPFAPTPDIQMQERMDSVVAGTNAPVYPQQYVPVLDDTF